MEKQPVKEETEKPIIIVERPEFMEPAPTLSPKIADKAGSLSQDSVLANLKTGLASESALRLDSVQPKTPKQKTE